MESFTNENSCRSRRTLWSTSNPARLKAMLAGLLLMHAELVAQCQPAWIQHHPATSPPGRYGHAMAYDSVRGAAVLFGGWNSSNNLVNDTWEYDGVNWTLQSPANSPVARGYSAMAYDSARGVTVLFGGCPSGSACLGDTWEYNGINWTQRTPATAPSARSTHAMAYDTARGVTVLFGGYDSSSYASLGDTWEWDGTNWTQRTHAHSPPARSDHGMAYDSLRGVTVLQWGDNGTNDTWEWDGTDWTQRALVEYPLPGNWVAYDAGRRVTTAYICGMGPEIFSREWNGLSWTDLAWSPPKRWGTAMVYHGALGCCLLFGGIGNGILQDTWALMPPARFIAQPVDTTVVEGSDAVLSAGAFGGLGIPRYQWRKDGVSIDGATGPTLRIARAIRSAAGSYDVVVTSGSCQVTSTSATLTILGFQPDFNADGHVDMVDFAIFQRCITGPVLPIRSQCTDPG